MTLLHTIKELHLQARKARHSALATALSTLLGDAERPGKNAGRESSDAEVTAVIKKFIKNLDEIIAAYSDGGRVVPEDTIQEREVLIGLLPAQLDLHQLKEAIATVIAENNISPKDVGKIMAALKAQYDGRYNGAAALAIIKGQA